MNKPVKDAVKIQGMFSSIAPRYDLLNRLLSFGRDRCWRKFAVNQLPRTDNAVFLDVATGTGDIALEIIKQHSGNTKVTGVDFSSQMLELGRKKIANLGWQERIDLRHGDANSLPFEDNTFDGAIIAFGIRNLPDYKRGLQEMTRVIKDNASVVILEFTNIKNRSFGKFYHLYLTKVLPLIGEIISGRKGAYRYLSRSVLDFPETEELKAIMLEAGLREVKYYLLTFGVVAVHVGIK